MVQEFRWAAQCPDLLHTHGIWMVKKGLEGSALLRNLHNGMEAAEEASLKRAAASLK